MLTNKIKSYKESKIKCSPCNSNRASMIGHECLRYLVYSRTDWEKKIMHDVRLQSIFDLGTDFEQIVLKELAASGIEVYELQRAFVVREYEGKPCNITGHIDGYIKDEDGNSVVLEIKSISPYAYDSVDDANSIKNHKYNYMRGYYSQIQLYMHVTEAPKAVLLYKNKVSGAYKEIWFDYSEDDVKAILAKAVEIEKHLSDKTLPEGVNNEECQNCGFYHLCCPPIDRTELKFIDDKDIELKLDRYYELKPFMKEYQEIDRELKKDLNEIDKAVFGNYLVTGKWQERKGFEVKPSKFWAKKIEVLNEN